MSEKESGDLRLSLEEANRLKKALKDEEFRRLLREYATEISDPENRAKYEREITELESMRGVDVQFVNPTPGFVLKTLLLPEKKKAFINICQSEVVEAATCTRAKDSRWGMQWRIPFSISPPREDLDKAAKNKCMVYDVVFHPETLKRGQENPRFKQMLVDTALDSIEKELNVELDRRNVKYLLMPFKGVPAPTVIRKKCEKPPEASSSDLPLKVPYPPLKEEVKAKSRKKQEEKKARKKRRNEPRYTITHRGELSIQDFTNARESTRIRRPRELVITVELPGVESTASVELDIFEKRLLLQCPRPDYRLDLALYYPVDEEKGRAKFDKKKKCLTITLPVIPQKTTLPPVKPLVTEITTESANQEQESESCDLESKSTNQKSVPMEHNAVVRDCSEAANASGSKATPANETDSQSHDSHMTQQWSSVGAWHCPPFSYQQDEEHVSFVLHTAGVKKSTLVSHFDQQSFQMTFRGVSGCGSEGEDSASQSYSFFVRFPEGCLLNDKGCRVDVSQENVVVMGRKAVEGGRRLWEKFEVGTNSNQTTEKLFLTAANVQSAVEQIQSLHDPWSTDGEVQDVECKVVSSSEEKLEVEISQPQTTTGREDSAQKIASLSTSAQIDTQNMATENSVEVSPTTETAPTENSAESPPTTETALTENGAESSPTTETALTENGAESSPTTETALTENGAESSPTTETALTENGAESSPTTETALTENGVNSSPTAETSSTDASVKSSPTTKTASSDAMSEEEAEAEENVTTAGLKREVGGSEVEGDSERQEERTQAATAVVHQGQNETSEHLTSTTDTELRNPSTGIVAQEQAETLASTAENETHDQTNSSQDAAGSSPADEASNNTPREVSSPPSTKTEDSSLDSLFGSGRVVVKDKDGSIFVSVGEVLQRERSADSAGGASTGSKPQGNATSTLRDVRNYAKLIVKNAAGRKDGVKTVQFSNDLMFDLD